MSTATDTRTRTAIKPPSMWTVVFHNDDYTPIDFVIAILMRHFNVGSDEAAAIAQKVHETGAARVGSFTKEIAETKELQVLDAAKRAEHPLKVTSEEA